jgi:hypothetical protein
MFEQLPRDEQPVVRGLCQLIFNMGNYVVIDNGEFVVKCSNMDEVNDEIFVCDEETLYIQDDLQHKGHFSLIYNNGSEGDGMIVIHDYSSNDLCEAIYNKLDEEFGDC